MILLKIWCSCDWITVTNGCKCIALYLVCRLYQYHKAVHTMGPRFEIYVKAASDGKSIGDCPFSQYVSMVAHLKIPEDQYTRIPVDFSNKSKEFLQLNPEGSVPVLVDTSNNHVITNSQLIVKYLEETSNIWRKHFQNLTWNTATKVLLRRPVQVCSPNWLPCWKTRTKKRYHRCAKPWKMSWRE